MADDDDDSEWAFETREVAEDTDAESSDEQTADDGEWRYSLTDLPDEDDDADDQSAIGGNVFGSLSSDTEIIEPGSPNLEGTLFVIAGVILALLFFMQFYLLMG